MRMVDGAVPLDPASEVAEGSSARGNADAQNGAFEGSDQTRASSGCILPRERPMEALRATIVNMDIDELSPARQTLVFELLYGLMLFACAVFRSRSQTGPAHARSDASSYACALRHGRRSRLSRRELRSPASARARSARLGSNQIQTGCPCARVRFHLAM